MGEIIKTWNHTLALLALPTSILSFQFHNPTVTSQVTAI